jgi:hypothetical protein
MSQNLFWAKKQSINKVELGFQDIYAKKNLCYEPKTEICGCP